MKQQKRTKRCPTCGDSFSYAVRRGADRKHCSSRCRQAARVRRYVATDRATWPHCSVDGCSKTVAGPRSKWCKACREQKRRTGAFGRKPHKGRTLRNNGYYTAVAVGHPLANRHGRVSEHRMVLFDRCSGVDPVCVWCGCDLQWRADRRAWNAVVADHVNEDKGDNRPENVVPACTRCNRARGAMVPFLRRLTAPGVELLIEMVRREAAHVTGRGVEIFRT